MIRSKDVDSTLVTKEASQFEATEDDADTDISSMASAPPSPLLPTSLPCVSASDRQTPLNTAQTCGSMVESACAVVAIAAAAQLLKESTPERTSSANVMQQQQMKSESEELAVRTQKYDIHEQATSSEHKAISFTTDHSGRHALPRDEVDSSRPLTGIPQQSSTESWQQVPRLDQPTSQACKGEQMRMVSNVGPESRPESLYEQKSSQISSRTEQTMTAQTTTTVEGSPRQVVKGVAGSLHFDIESDYAESLRSSHRSIDEDSSPLDLEQSLPADAFSVQFPHLTHSSHSDSCPSAERPGGIPQYFPYPSESQSPAIMSSPAEYSEAEAGTVTTLANQIHGNVTKHDVGFEEHVSTFSVLADSSSMVPAERIEPRTLDDVRVYPPASSLSPSSLTPTAGEPSVGKRADQVVESSECALSIVHVPPSHGTLGVEYSSGEFTGLASSLAQEERTKIVHMQTTPGVDSDHKWQINTGIHDSKEPPPSYQDAVSDYEYSSVQPSDALTGDEYLSLRQRTQHSGGQKSGTLNVASNEFRQGSEEGASALERRSALRATLLRNDKEVGESTSLPVEGEAVLGTRQKLSIQGVGSASKTDGERVLDQQIGVVSRECASTSGAVTTQHPVETISPFRSTSPYEVRTTPITNSFEDAVSSRRQEYQGHMTTGGIHVSKVDEEKDTNYRCTQRRPVTPTFPQTQATRATLSTAVAMQGNDEGVSNTVSPVLAPENTIILSHSEATESHGCSVTEDDKQVESEDRQCTRRVDGSYEQRRTTQSSDYAGRTSSDRDIEETIISNEHAVVQQEPKSTLTVESTAVHSRTRTKCIDSTPEQPITALTPSASFGRGDVDTFPSSPDAHNARVTFKNTDEYLGTTTATDQLSERIEKEVVEHSTTDIESSRSDLIIRSAVIQTSQLGTSKPQHSVDDVVDSSSMCAFRFSSHFYNGFCSFLCSNQFRCHPDNEESQCVRLRHRNTDV
ncbi:hypothetical protein OG21DRAFT_1283970 [Imleria badia]|nr:hypothetical protein OG21DRAFT_1283970 [Imleria badia]